MTMSNSTITPNDNTNKTTKVQLTLHASNLRNVAGMFRGTSDPFAVVTLLPIEVNSTPKVLGKTEAIKNTLSPMWTKVFYLDYELGKPLHVNVGVYDEIRDSKDKSMGSAVFEIGEILGSRGNVKAKKLRGNGGSLFARVEKAPVQSSGCLTLGLVGIDLKNVEGGAFGRGLSDPFFELSRRVEGPAGSAWRTVFRSKQVENDLNPKWEEVTVDLDRLCDGDEERPVMVSVFDYEKSGKHKSMGSFETTLNDLLAAKVELNDEKTSWKVSVSVFDHKKKESDDDGARGFILKKKGKVMGKIVVVEAAVVRNGRSDDDNESSASPSDTVWTPQSTVTTAPLSPLPREQRPTFVDYISGGCELQMCFAIDFTGSNGDPRVPGTPHHICRDGRLNDYEKAITAVGSIVAKYDSDQRFPVWGFGAKYDGELRNCFQVGPRAEVQGIKGVLEAYRSVFRSPVIMSSPTVFTDVIRKAATQAYTAQEAAHSVGNQCYTVLLILTSGTVRDIEATRDAIAAAGKTPLSIVIVGIGDTDFSAMRFLDDFAEGQQHGPAVRDITQFVEFRKHQHDKHGLTQKTLEEIPNQLVDYFYDRGMMPNPILTGSKLQIVPEEYDEETDTDLNLHFSSSGRIAVADEVRPITTNSYDFGVDVSRLSILPPPVAPPSEPETTPYPVHASMPTAAPQPASPPGADNLFRASYVPTQSYTAPSSSSTSPYLIPINSSTRPYRPQTSHTTQRPYQPSSQTSMSRPYQPPSNSVFQVRVPPGVAAGYQLRVKNPATGQMMLVAVPHGVPPGGIFEVCG